jgi:hypothetical protein
VSGTTFARVRVRPLSAADRSTLLATLNARFDANPTRHTGVTSTAVLARIDGNAAALRSLHEMEASGGEPDVIAHDATSGVVTFCDCAAESPQGRRSLCFDREALDARKEAKPKSSAIESAEAMGVSLLTEDEYRHLQSLGEFDLKTSSWIGTPAAVRALGGALFGDRRYARVFIYHNGAQSYYAARGFRGLLRV